MADIKELFQSADWKQEKHVPVIEASEVLKICPRLKYKHNLYASRGSFKF